MHRRLVIGILLACLLALPVLPALALGSGTPISPANAVGVVELARFGRGLVYDLAWTPDGGSLVVAGAPGVWVYNAADVTAAPRLLAGHTETVRSVDVSPTGALIVSGSVDDSVRLWDTASGAQVLALQDATTAARDLYVVRFFPDGSRVAAAGGDYTVHVWNTDGTLVYTLAGHTRTINALALNAAGTVLASAADDNTVYLWDMATGAQSGLIQHTTAIKAVALSGDGTRVVTGDSSGDVILWDATSGQQLAILDRSSGRVYDLAFSADGARVFAAMDDNLIYVLDAGTLAQQATWVGHADDVTCFALSPNGATLASADLQENIYLWDVASGTQIAAVPGHTDIARSATFSPDGTLILAGHSDGEVYVWPVDGNDVDYRFANTGHQNIDGNYTTTAFTADGTRYASADGFGVHLFDAATGTELFNLDDSDTGLINSFAFSLDGSLLAVTTWDGPVLLWDTATGTLAARLLGHTDNSNSIEFNANGSLIVTASDDGTVRVWGLP